MIGVLLTTLLLYILPRRACFSHGEGSFGLSYNGGRIMTEPVTVSLLWFGTEWEESGQEAVRNAIKSLSSSQYNSKNSEVPTLGDWWEIIRQYIDDSNTRVTDRVDVGAECFYTGPQLNMTLDRVINIAAIAFNQSIINESSGLNLACTRAFEANRSTIHFTVFSHTVKFSDGDEERELTGTCMGDFMVLEAEVKMMWVRAPQNENDQCSMFFRGDDYMGPPNRDERIDSLVGFVLAIIAEVATNGDGRGWIGSDGSGWSVSSSCGDVFEKGKNGPPLYADMERNMSFNGVGLNGYRYIVQYIWDQSINNCALKLSETCGINALVLKQPKGYLRTGVIVNHSNGLQPYPPNQKCQWKIQYPTAKFISFTFNYFAVGGSNDHLKICQSDSSPSQCSTFQSNGEDFDKTFKLMGSKAYVEFVSGNRVPFESRGLELSYSAGLCNGKEDVYDKEGVIGYTSSPGYSYVKGLSCQWILHGKRGTLVTLSFTHINITRDFDFLAIYNGTMWEMANFSGFYSSSNLPKLNLTGKVMIAFATQTENGEGWSANFYISSPIDRNREKLIVLLLVILTSFLISCAVALVILALVRRKRRLHLNLVEINENLMLIRVEVSGEESQIGEGPTSIVYRAISTDGVSIALKSPKDLTPSRTKLEEEILLKTSLHPNIISLVGYGEDGVWGRYLVFEYMSRGSLSKNLREKGETLEWEKRLAIAIQISSAIQTLHMYLKPPIRHGNITSENVLLDEYYNAKLAGFGAASYCANYEANSEIPSDMAKDIRSFGLLLVELLRGEARGDGFEEVNRIELDQRLGIPKEEYKMGGLMKLGEIAKWCISTITPKIGDVVLGLKQVEQLFNSAEV